MKIESKAFDNIIKVCIFICLVAIIVEFFPHQTNKFKYNVEIGKPWGYELVTAEFDFPIYKTDEQVAAEKSMALQQEYVPCYRFIGGENIDMLVISIEEMEKLKKNSLAAIQIVDNQHTLSTYKISDLHTPKSAYTLTKETLMPNLEYDEETSNQLYNTIIASISLTQGMVQKGEKIIDKGEIINEQTYQMLISLQKAYQEKGVINERSIYSIIGDILVACILLTLLVLYLCIFRSKTFAHIRNLLFFSILMAVMVSLSYVIIRFTHLSIYLVPFAWVPILICVFFDSRTALFVHLITTMVVSFMVTMPFEFIIVQIAVGMITISTMEDISQRAQLAQTALYILFTYAIVYTAFTLTATGDIHQINGWMYLVFAVNALFVLFVYGLIYLCERGFGFVSSITLIELTNVSSNLMIEFAEKAPGTFQHSLQVSNLATEAAKKIGAKALLVRAGAMYHDIGKMTHPENYTENQQGGENPLLKMEFEQAAAAVIEHVSEGVKLAKKHHLPEVIITFIQTHHGTSKVKYFYNSWVNAHPDEVPNERLFMYDGPQPSTKEMAILMMADAVEARSRSLKEYTEESISDMVEQMIDAQMADGQFKNTPLSFSDVETIKQVFKSKIISMNHHRISYPEIKK